MLEPEQDIVIVALERDEAYRLMTHHLKLAEQSAARERNAVELTARLVPATTAVRMIGEALDRFERHAISAEVFRVVVRGYVTTYRHELSAVMKRQEAEHAALRISNAWTGL